MQRKLPKPLCHAQIEQTNLKVIREVVEKYNERSAQDDLSGDDELQGGHAGRAIRTPTGEESWTI